MNQYSEEKLANLTNKKFKRLIGVKREDFNIMVEVVEDAYKERHKKGGRPSNFKSREKVIVLLLYIKNYNAMEDYGIQFDLPKSVVCDYVHEVLEVLLLNKNFTLFGKKHTKFDSSEDRLLDVTEIRILRPKYNQKDKYSGKKHYHTMKIQIIKGKNTGFIYEIQIGPGKEHDFHLFKRTFEGSPDNITYTADLGYIGINKITNGNTPYKKSKKHPLTEKEEEYNKELAKERIYIEHTNSWIKRFKILSTKFRNNLKYFASFAVLVCALFNLDIA